MQDRAAVTGRELVHVRLLTAMSPSSFFQPVAAGGVHAARYRVDLFLKLRQEPWLNEAKRKQQKLIQRGPETR